MKIDNSPVRGTRDLLPAAVADREQVLALISGVYRRYGYQRIETPCLEDIGRLVSREAGENEKLIYHVLRRGLDETVPAGTAVSDLADLGLRFDLTVPLSRFYGHNHAALPVPFRSLQIGSVWRAERPQKGRYRQFTQCDVDLIGENPVLAEAELIEAPADALAAVGLDGATIRLSDRRFLCVLAEGVGLGPNSWPTFFIGLDKLDKIGREGVRAELGSRGMPAGPVDAALEKIASLQDLPAAAVPDRLAESVPAVADGVIADLATTFASTGWLTGGRWDGCSIRRWSAAWVITRARSSRY